MFFAPAEATAGAVLRQLLLLVACPGSNMPQGPIVGRLRVADHSAGSTSLGAEVSRTGTFVAAATELTVTSEP